MDKAKVNLSLLTVGSLAIETGVKQCTLKRWASAGLIPFRVDSTNRRIFDEESIKAAKALHNRKDFPLPRE